MSTINSQATWNRSTYVVFLGCFASDLRTLFFFSSFFLFLPGYLLIHPSIYPSIYPSIHPTNKQRTFHFLSSSFPFPFLSFPFLSFPFHFLSVRLILFLSFPFLSVPFLSVRPSYTTLHYVRTLHTGRDLNLNLTSLILILIFIPPSLSTSTVL